MKILLSPSSSSILLEVKHSTNKTMNALLAEAMELLAVKYQQKDHNDQQQKFVAKDATCTTSKT